MSYFKQPDPHKNISPFILFSFWAFVWVIFYYIAVHSIRLPLIKYANPIVSIFVALLFQLVALFYVFLYSSTQKIPIILFKLLILTLVFKLAPFLLVYQNDLNSWKESAISFLFVGAMYLVYLFSRGLEPFSIYIDLLNSIAADDNRVPPYWIILQ